MPAMNPKPPHPSEAAQLAERVRAVVPQIGARAAQTERDRMVPAENIALLKETGLHRVFLPRAYGGYEAPLPVLTHCLMDIAGACASTAWVFGLMCTHHFMLAHFPKRLQDEVWLHSPDATASSSIAPLGQHEEVDGGIRLSGRFGWSSGCDHTEWAIVGVNRPQADGSKTYCLAVLPRQDYTIDDDWDSAGMAGSGSKTLVLDQVFIPDYRIQPIDDMLREGKSAGISAHPDSRLFHAPYRPYFASIFAAIGLGIAQRMLDLFVEKNRNRRHAYNSIAVGTQHHILQKLGQSAHQIRAARALMETSWLDHQQHAEAQRYPSQETAVAWRTDQAYAVNQCAEAVNRLFIASGASAWPRKNPLQRLFRDMNITAAHAYTNYDLCAEAMGRELMGLAPDPAVAPAP